MTTLLWLRRDLRLHDHAALATALAGTGSVQPVFVFDRDILARFSNPQDRRVRFLIATLCDLDAKLRRRGGGLLVLHGRAVEVIPKLAHTLAADTVICAEDFEPATIARDAAVKKALGPTTRFVQVLDHLMNHPARMLKADGTPYKVFTPFYNKCWQPAISPGDMGELVVHDAGRYAPFATNVKQAQAAGLQVLDVVPGPQAMAAAMGYQYQHDAQWSVQDAPTRLADFIAQRLAPYKTARDFMAQKGTSQLSPYLRFGLVSIREVMRAATAAGGGEKWIAELGWREFYACILMHFPRTVDEEFTEHYRGSAIAWSRNEAHRAAFEAGQTGYPIVDAAVRELLQTGWMHNRARMIVASFFTKHLLLDWRLGEAFFAQHLMDYELASNVGGWQWAASTGTDAAPYFRVFNPMLQSKKFDAPGDYIRRYMPELRDLSDAEIHAPWESARPPAGYPAPIVDHATARARVLEVFKRAGNTKPAH